MDHFILTRFNVSLGREEGEKGCDPDWLEHRFELFQQHTLRSVRRQSCKRFQWLCFFSENTPERFIYEAESCWPAEIVLVPHCDTAAYRWRTFLRAAALAVTCRTTSDWVAQTRLDNDDFIAWDFVEHIRHNLQETREWLTYPEGAFFTDSYYRAQWPVNPFITLVEPITELATPYSTGLDGELDDFLPRREISSETSWCCNIHGSNLANSTKMTENAESLSTPAMERRFIYKSLTRIALLNSLIERRNYQRYLEIGVYQRGTFDKIDIPQKVGVDPKGSDGIISLTSDDFFASRDFRDETFDLVFIDGLHHWENVLRDVDNALSRLNPNGVIIVHDCMPSEYEHQLRQPSPLAHQGAWNGDVWKAFVKLRARPDLDCAVLNSDHGLGVIIPRPNTQPIECPAELTWPLYCERRDELLRTVNVPDLWEFLG